MLRFCFVNKSYHVLSSHSGNFFHILLYSTIRSVDPKNVDVFYV